MRPPCLVDPQNNREGDSKFLRCSLNFEGTHSIMEPVEYSSISLSSKIELWVRIWEYGWKSGTVICNDFQKSFLKLLLVPETEKNSKVKQLAKTVWFGPQLKHEPLCLWTTTDFEGRWRLQTSLGEISCTLPHSQPLDKDVPWPQALFPSCLLRVMWSKESLKVVDAKFVLLLSLKFRLICFCCGLSGFKK